jgi:hypothetical protein
MIGVEFDLDQKIGEVLSPRREPIRRQKFVRGITEGGPLTRVAFRKRLRSRTFVEPQFAHWILAGTSSHEQTVEVRVAVGARLIADRRLFCSARFLTRIEPSSE